MYIPRYEHKCYTNHSLKVVVISHISMTFCSSRDARMVLFWVNGFSQEEKLTSLRLLPVTEALSDARSQEREQYL